MSDPKRTAPKGPKRKPSRPRAAAAPAAAPLEAETEVTSPPASSNPPAPAAMAAGQLDAVVSDSVPPPAIVAAGAKDSDEISEVGGASPGKPDAEPKGEPSVPREGGQPVRAARATDEYTLQANFDRNARQFVATCLEFPNLKAVSGTRDHALRDLEGRLESHIQDLRRRGTPLPEPVFSRRYPEKIELRISHVLYRRLDLLSRQEKITLDHLLVELLTSAVDKRFEGPSRAPQQHQQHQQQERRPDQRPDRRPDTRQDQRGNQRHQQAPHGNRRHQQGGGPGPRGRSYHETMDSRENFLEYVRSLEKGGGAPPGRWKK